MNETMTNTELIRAIETLTKLASITWNGGMDVKVADLIESKIVELINKL